MKAMMLPRRTILLGGLAAVTLGGASLAVVPANTRKRFVVVILRGALDGLSAVVPYGDANLRNWRGSLVLPEPGRDGGMLDLGGFWGLHPALAQLHALYRAGEALPVHAVAGPNHSRSHFEAQDILECGAEQRMDSGWLNRLAGALPSDGGGDNAVALGQSLPLILRGPNPVNAWGRGNVPTASADFYTHLLAIHDHDPLTKARLADGLRERGFNAHALDGMPGTGGDAPFVALARTGGRLLAKPDGPRLAVLEIEGWDTHSNQNPRLGYALPPLDKGIAALKDGLGAAWAETVVLVTTEFGRTVRVNGTGGTDHGTGTVAFVLGGPVAGGRVQADWPGLAEAKLFENRDVQPTLDIRGLTKGLLQAHYGLNGETLEKVFPGSAAATPATGLLRV
jgi:uncharacterized protein (DUF1501 family)